MGTDLQAFTIQTTLDNFPKKIEAIECAPEGLLAALADGSLILLKPDSSGSGPWQVSQSYRSVCKRGSSQIQLWKAKSLLLIIGDEGLNAYHFPAMKLACQAGRSKGVHRFALDEQRNMLALAVKKRLMLFQHSGNEFVDLKDISLSESALALQWIGDSICVGYKREYVLVNSSTGAITDMFNVGKAAGPCMVSLSRSDVLVAKDNVAISVGLDGRPNRKAGITWSDAPHSMIIARPHAVALLQNCVEVRSAQRDAGHKLTQVLPVKDMSLMAPSVGPDGSVHIAAAGEAGARRLAPTPFAQQAQALADAHEFAEALSVAAMMPSSQGAEQTRLTDSLHIRYGHQLFQQGDQEEAFSHFAMCSYANPTVILRLFPSLTSEAMLEPLLATLQGIELPDLAEPEAQEREQVIAALLPYLLSHRSRLAILQTQDSVASDATETPRAAQQSSDGKMTELAVSPGIPKALWPAAASAIDTAIMKAMLAMSDTGALLRFVQRPNAVDTDEGSSALSAAGRYSELVALLQSRGLHEQALELLQLISLSPEKLDVPPTGVVRRRRSCRVEGVTGAWAAVRYIVDLGTHETDLIKHHARWILQVDAEAALEMLSETQPAIDPSMVLPILSAQAPALCAVYLETAIQKDIASPETYHMELAHIYLRLALNQRHERASGNATDESAPSQETPHANPALNVSPQQAATRLNELVLASEYLDPYKLLTLLPSNDLPHLRALLLERTGQHQDALRIYVHVLKDARLAEGYCDRLYDVAATARRQASHEAASSSSTSRHSGSATGHSSKSSSIENLNDDPRTRMYMALIQIYLEKDEVGVEDDPGKEQLSSTGWGEVARLLSRKHDRIDPLQALKLLPDEVSLRAVLPFVEGSLRAAGEQQRNSAVVRSLRRSENLNVSEEVTRCKQRAVTVTFERACHLCHKRIGNAAFVAYPEGGLAHYSCFKRDAERLAGTQDGRKKVHRPLLNKEVDVSA